MARHPSRGAVLAIAGLLVLSACGGDDSDDADSEAPTVTTSPTSETPGPDPDGTVVPPTTSEPTTTQSTTTPATDTPDTTATPTTATPTTSASTTPATTAGTDRDDLDPLVIVAIDDLADAQGRAVDDIELVTFELVTWRDGSLGCPEPDRSYTQALVDGYRIVLSIDGTLHHYHGADTGQPFPCESPADPAPGGSGGGDT